MTARTRYTAVALFIVALATTDATASCVGTLTFSTGNPSSIGIRVGSGWSTAPPIGAAINLWANNCGGMGTDYPTLRNDTSGSIDVFVEKKSGAIPQSDAGCARFVPDVPNGQLTGGVIEVYERDSAGNDCLWIMPHATLDNVLAHEIGHVLGLANVGEDGSSCAGYIMSPDYATANPQADECEGVDETNLTPAEIAQENCDLQCSEPCTGTTPSCPTGGGTGGGADSCRLYGCSPLLLDLNGDGIHTTDVDVDPVLFDMTADGIPDRTGWTDGTTEEGILYFDKNRNRVLDDASELFGDVTRMPDGSRARHGFEALSVYDLPKNGGNGDGALSPADRMWGRIRLWVDRDHDGRMSNDENFSLGERHIVQLDLAFEENASGVDASGNDHRFIGTFVMRSRGTIVVRALHDVFYDVTR